MNNDLLQFLQNMTVEEIKNQLEQFVFEDAELDAVKSGKETIDNLVKLNNDSSSKVGWYLVLYAIYKLKGGN